VRYVLKFIAFLHNCVQLTYRSNQRLTASGYWHGVCKYYIGPIGSARLWLCGAL